MKYKPGDKVWKIHSKASDHRLNDSTCNLELTLRIQGPWEVTGHEHNDILGYSYHLKGLGAIKTQESKLYPTYEEALEELEAIGFQRVKALVWNRAEKFCKKEV